MKKIVLMVLVLIFVQMLFAQDAFAAKQYREKYYQNEWCGRYHGIQEYKLRDGARVDCLTKNYAVEFDFAPKWAEGYGQAVYYAEKTGRKPAVILIIESPSDWRYYNRIKSIANKNGMQLWYMKSPAYDGSKPAAKQPETVDFDKICRYICALLKQFGIL